MLVFEIRKCSNARFAFSIIYLFWQKLCSGLWFSCSVQQSCSYLVEDHLSPLARMLVFEISKCSNARFVFSITHLLQTSVFWFSYSVERSYSYLVEDHLSPLARMVVFEISKCSNACFAISITHLLQTSVFWFSYSVERSYSYLVEDHLSPLARMVVFEISKSGVEGELFVVNNSLFLAIFSP